jgi:hypothetical protein
MAAYRNGQRIDDASLQVLATHKSIAASTIAIPNLMACPSTMDGINIAEVGVDVFLKDGADPDGLGVPTHARNGVYTVLGVAAGGLTVSLGRAFHANIPEQIGGMAVEVTGGLVNGGLIWHLPLAAASITLDTTPLLYVPLKVMAAGIVIPANVDLYVNTDTGNDADTGADWAHAVLTVARALELAAFASSGQYRIYVDGAAVSTFPPPSLLARTGKEPLTFFGTEQETVPDTVLTGVAPSADGLFRRVLSGFAGLGVDSQIGMWVEALAPAARAGNRYQVVSNTAGTITIMCDTDNAYAATLAPGDHVRVIRSFPIFRFPATDAGQVEITALKAAFRNIRFDLTLSGVIWNDCDLHFDTTMTTNTSGGPRTWQHLGGVATFGPLRQWRGTDASIPFSDLAVPTSLLENGVYLSNTSLSVGGDAVVQVSSLVAVGAVDIYQTGSGLLSIACQQFDGNTITATGSSALLQVGTGTASYPYSHVQGPGPYVFAVLDGAEAVFNGVDILGVGAAYGIYAAGTGALVNCTTVIGSGGTYGIFAVGGATVRMDATTTLTGILPAGADLYCDGLKGSHVAVAASGLRGRLGTRIDRDNPTAYSDCYLRAQVASTGVIADLSSCPVAQDGFVLAENDIFFVKDTASPDGGATPASAAYNGPYKVGAVVGPNAPLTRWYRAQTAEQLAGCMVYVERGTINGNMAWSLPLDPASIVVDTTPLNFVEVLWNTIAVVRKDYDPVARVYVPGRTDLVTYTPPSTAGAFLPTWWQLPGKLGNVTAGIELTFTDAAGVTSTLKWDNNGPAMIVTPWDTLDIDKDAQRVTLVVFYATNGAAVDENQDMGAWQFHGFACWSGGVPPVLGEITDAQHGFRGRNLHENANNLLSGNLPPVGAENTIPVSTGTAVVFQDRGAWMPVIETASFANVVDLTAVNLAAVFDATYIPVENDRVGLFGTVSRFAGDPASTAHGGIFTVGPVGGGVAAFTRATDANTAARLYCGATVKVRQGLYTRRVAALECAIPMVLDASTQNWFLLPDTAQFDTWANFLAGRLAAPGVAYADQDFYVTSAGTNSLWKCIRSGAGTWQWEPIWSAWYGATIDRPVATGTVVGLKFYNTDTLFHEECRQTGAATFVWEAILRERINVSTGGTTSAAEGTPFATGGFTFHLAEHQTASYRLRATMARDGGTGKVRIYDSTLPGYVLLNGALDYLTPTTALLAEYNSDAITLTDAHDYVFHFSESDPAQILTWGTVELLAQA